MKGKFILAVSVFILSYLLFFSHLTLGEEKVKVVVVLKKQAQVTDRFIYLKDIAEKIEADQSLIKKLSGLKVGSSPLPGKKRSLNEELVLVRLYQNGFSPDEVEVCGEREVVVFRKGSPFSDEKGDSSEEGENYKRGDFFVREGDIVSLVVEEPNLRVITRGRALQSGKKGEVIEVINISSFKRLKGRITAPFTVKVNPLD
ncbi:stage V sporulation protein AA [Candidatus Aerophobetes bacterium]|nr:stage V sporulation protein AA [Candidatus Aerophobetes bacterium]